MKNEGKQRRALRQLERVRINSENESESDGWQEEKERRQSTQWVADEDCFEDDEIEREGV